VPLHLKFDFISRHKEGGDQLTNRVTLTIHSGKKKAWVFCVCGRQQPWCSGGSPHEWRLGPTQKTRVGDSIGEKINSELCLPPWS
jgi:hypothetical protein